MIESEFKCMLNADDYKRIFSKLKNKYNTKTVLQTNYFYDTEDLLLDKNDITFRIRHKETGLTIQLKSPIKREGFLSVKKELAKRIEALPASIDIESSDWSEYLPDAGLISLKGMLLTERTTCIAENGIEIDLDKNFYLGFVDYELEIEFPSSLEDEALNILNDLVGDNLITPEGGKRERFFSKLKAMGTYKLY